MSQVSISGIDEYNSVRQRLEIKNLKINENTRMNNNKYYCTRNALKNRLTTE